MRLTTVFAAFVLLLVNTPARAQIVELTPAQQIVWFLSIVQSVTKARGLNDDDASAAQRDAFLWLHVGPCKGNMGKLSDYDAKWSLELFELEARKSDSKATIAMREIVFLLMNRGLGRGDDEALCNFAREFTAAPTLSVPKAQPR